MKNKIIFTLVSLVLLVNLCSFASAYEVSITVPEVINGGEMISFNYIISSDIEETIRFIPHIDCMSGPDDFLNEEVVTIDPDNPHEWTHSFVEVSYREWFENGYCSASIMVIEPEQQTFSETFEIKIADHLDAKTDTYAPGKRGNKRVFLVGEPVEIRNEATTNTYEETIVAYTTTISLEDDNVGTYTGENVFFVPTLSGYYTVRTITEATGFMPDTTVTRFTVVAEHARPTEVEFICNFDGTCDPRAGETSGNCVLDCPLEEPAVSYDPLTAQLEPEPKGWFLGGWAAGPFGGMYSAVTISLLIVIIVLVIAAGIMFRSTKKKRRGFWIFKW